MTPRVSPPLSDLLEEIYQSAIILNYSTRRKRLLLKLTAFSFFLVLFFNFVKMLEVNSVLFTFLPFYQIEIFNLVLSPAVAAAGPAQLPM